MVITVQVQAQPFDPGQLTNSVHAGNPAIGALVCFTGYVRDLNLQHEVQGLFLEHFPGLTEKSLQQIAEQAAQRWPLQAVHVLHRIGQLTPAEPIVFVAAASAHRQDAFDACAFIMDYLKTRAPFWKKEFTTNGSHWVEGRDSDQQAAARWNEHPEQNA